MTNRLLTRTAAAICLLTATASLTLAQDNASTDRRDRQDARQQSQPEWGIAFSFPGGTAVEYVEAVRAASDDKNVVVMPGCENFSMPGVELSGVSTRGALAALEFATPIDAATDARLILNEMGDVFVVVPSVAGKDIFNTTSTAVFSLAEMIEVGAVEAGDVLTAVEAALELSGSDTPKMRYHPETRLLMVRGAKDDLAAVERVLRGVKDSASVLQVGAKRIEEIRQNIEETRAELEAIRAQITESNAYADEVKTLAEQGGAGPLDVLKSREEVIQLQRDQAELESRLTILQERLERERARSQPNTEASQHTAH